jgi:L-ornithine N5-monooxygenase
VIPSYNSDNIAPSSSSIAMAPLAGGLSFSQNGFAHDSKPSEDSYAYRSDPNTRPDTHYDANLSFRNQSLLPPTDENKPLDLLCVGFGPASLGIGVALHDFLDKSETPAELAGLNGRLPNVAFLEKQAHFAWHAGMLLPGTKMQISFLKDMATLRNPRSEFTFLNYLHRNDRLVPFTNLGTFLPQRVEYEDYMRWCASWFDDVVYYNREVVSIAPHTDRLPGQPVFGDFNSGMLRQPVEYFDVTTRDMATGAMRTFIAKNVVIAAGGQANIPAPFPQNHPKVIHSSQFNKMVKTVLPEREAPYKVAVVGAGQSAAEIFNYLHQYYPNSRTRLLIRGSALRPSDDSPL